MKSTPFLLGLLAASLAVDAATPAGPRLAPDYAVPHFADASRRQRIEALRPEIDREFSDYAAKKNFPGFVWGIVLDGELIHTGARGLANVEQKIPAAADTRFRIASMTKSFTALAILRLRDAGKLSLADPAEKFVPELRAVQPLTSDAPAITVRHLLTMSPGFPEDNPWGDRQLSVRPADLRAFVRQGLSLSNPPGVAFEYSNLAYALLGEIITQVSGVPYQQYITREILQPLGMRDTVWEYTEVPADKLALGYRSEGNGWRLEPLLHDGSYGAMGGLLTTLHDLARYEKLHLDAWPPRDGPESTVARRATLREMHQPAVIVRLTTDGRTADDKPKSIVSGYSYGLGWTMDQEGVVWIAHSGGLPGFGSNHRFYPDHGIAILSFANLTYAGTSAVNARVGAWLIEKARLPRRELPVSSVLQTRQQQVASLLQSWDEALGRELVAENFFLDRSRESWIAHARDSFSQIGAVRSIGPVVPENQLRGTFTITGEKGRLTVFFTLTPEAQPKVQELRLTVVR